jgi:Winged helix DNA-binding domain
LTDLRSWWWHRQGLDGDLRDADPAAVLAGTGWARSVGGVNPYLTLFARAGTSREAADAAVAALEIYELPSARGCTYVVPREHFGLALQVGRSAPEADVKLLERLGVGRSEVDRLCAAVVDIVTDQPMDPSELKEELGDAVRNLGEEGRKRGQATTLPTALGLLQAAGEIRRVPVNGRLDQQRYGYVRWTPPATGLSDDAARAELARLYFDWIGPASMSHFRWFSAFSAAAAKVATAGLGLVDVGDGLLALPDRAKEYAGHTAPAKPQYQLLASIDALILLRRDHAAMLSSEDAARGVPGGKPAAQLGGIADLLDHPIVDRGRLVGLWQYDTDAGSIVWWTFSKPDKASREDKAMREAVARTEAYVRDQVGDARSFSLDSPKARAPRLAALKAAAG